MWGGVNKKCDGNRQLDNHLLILKQRMLLKLKLMYWAHLNLESIGDLPVS